MTESETDTMEELPLEDVAEPMRLTKRFSKTVFYYMVDKFHKLSEVEQ